MVGQCLLLIACLIAGYLCGSYGRLPCDGRWILGKEPGDSKIEMPLSEEVMLRRKYILLRVVKRMEEV